MSIASRITRPLVLLIAGGFIAAACGRSDDQRTETVDPREVMEARERWPTGVAERVDSGNAAYRGGDYVEALRHFEEATRLGPEIPAAWFGVYMTQHAQGNLAAADSALRRAQALVPGATLLRHGDTLR